VSYYNALVVLQAVIVTWAIFVVLTVFTMQSRINFSSWGPLYVHRIRAFALRIADRLTLPEALNLERRLPSLGVFLLCFIFSGILYAFLPFNSVAEYFYCSIGALLFSAYIVYDTYMICNRLSQEEYILGAIDLYAY